MASPKKVAFFFVAAILCLALALTGCSAKEKAKTQKSGFAVHFIDVGQADAALVLCDGKAMLIDGGNVADSRLMYSYLKSQGVTYLDYVVASHPEEDHIGGLSGALNYATAGTVYCPTAEFPTDAFASFTKTLDKQGLHITVPHVGQSFSLGSARCTVLAVNTVADDPNDSSIVLRIVYGDTSFLFTGDAGREVEQALLSNGKNLSSTVLKVGHHGAASATSYVWLRQVLPQYAVISAGQDNGYGHPTDAALSRLQDAEVTTFRTDLQGTILCTSDGKTLSFTVARNPDADVFSSSHTSPIATVPSATTPAATIPGKNKPNETTPAVTLPAETFPEVTTGQALEMQRDYVVNTNTYKFHYPDCASADDISPQNRWDYFGTRQALIDSGYSPCGRCHP